MQYYEPHQIKFLLHVYALDILLILESTMCHQFYSYQLNKEEEVIIKDHLQHLIQFHYCLYLIKDRIQKRGFGPF